MKLAGPGPTRFEGDMHPGAIALTILGFALWLAAMAALIRAILADQDVSARAVAAGLLISMGIVLAAFVVNRNLSNPDNYRYLVDAARWYARFGWIDARVPGPEGDRRPRAGLA